MLVDLLSHIQMFILKFCCNLGFDDRKTTSDSYPISMQSEAEHSLQNFAASNLSRSIWRESSEAYAQHF